VIGQRNLVSPWENFLSATRDKGGATTLELAKLPLGEIGLWILTHVVRDNPLNDALNLSGTLSPSRWSARISDYYGMRSFTAELQKPEVKLRSLDMSRCQLGMRELKLIAEFVAASPTLTHLDLSHNQGGESVTRMTRFNKKAVVISPCPGLHALLDALQLSKSCTSLNLANNQIDNLGAWALADALRCPSFPIQRLAVGANPLGRAGGVDVAEALRVNTSLTHLDLRGDSIYKLATEVVLAVSKSLAKYNDTLLSLDLSGNLIEDGGAIALASALKRDLRYRSTESKLVHLNLSNGGITGQGLIVLARALDSNLTLRSLDVSGNTKVDDKSLALLFAELARNSVHLHTHSYTHAARA
jgi:hypothetical protein